MLHWWKNNKKHIKYAENLSYTITFEVTEKAFELLFGGFDVCSERAGKTQGRSDRKCEIWRTPCLLVSNMWPVISLTAPVITGAAYSSALCELKLWASGSSDCSSESFIISPLMAECSVWAQSNTTIQLPDKKLTNLHLQHFYFPPPPPLGSKTSNIWQKQLRRFVIYQTCFGCSGVLQRWTCSHFMSHCGWKYKWKNDPSCFCNVTETHFSFLWRSFLHLFSLRDKREKQLSESQRRRRATISHMETWEWIHKYCINKPLNRFVYRTLEKSEKCHQEEKVTVFILFMYFLLCNHESFSVMLLCF